LLKKIDIRLKFKLRMYKNLLSRWKTISFWKQSLLHGTNYHKGKQHKRFFFHRAWLKLVNCSKEYLWGRETHRELCLTFRLHVFIKVCRVELKWDHEKPYRTFWMFSGQGQSPAAVAAIMNIYDPGRAVLLLSRSATKEPLWHDACGDISKQRSLQTYFTWPTYNYSILGRSFPSAYSNSTSA